MKTSITLRLFNNIIFIKIFFWDSLWLLVKQSGSPKKTPIKFFNKILIENIRNIKKYEIHQQDFSPKSFFEIVTKIIKYIQIVNKIIYTKNVFGIITNSISKKINKILHQNRFLRLSLRSSNVYKLSTRSSTPKMFLGLSPISSVKKISIFFNIYQHCFWDFHQCHHHQNYQQDHH